MITFEHTCPECGLNDTIEVMLPRHPHDPQEAGSIDPAQCCCCGKEFDRKALYEMAREQGEDR